jgi:hypothetical protein
MPNAELAYRVLDHIDAHPESWVQSSWLHAGSCGTAGCFAGWATQLAGMTAVFEDVPGFSGVRYFQYVVPAEGGPTSVSEAAEQVLGIHTLDAYELFSAVNTREDLGRHVEEIFGPRPVAEPVARADLALAAGSAR